MRSGGRCVRSFARVSSSASSTKKETSRTTSRLPGDSDSQATGDREKVLSRLEFKVSVGGYRWKTHTGESVPSHQCRAVSRLLLDHGQIELKEGTNDRNQQRNMKIGIEIRTFSDDYLPMKAEPDKCNRTARASRFLAAATALVKRGFLFLSSNRATCRKTIVLGRLTGTRDLKVVAAGPIVGACELCNLLSRYLVIPRY